MKGEERQLLKDDGGVEPAAVDDQVDGPIARGKVVKPLGKAADVLLVALLLKRQEQIRLALKARVHRTLRKTRLLGDRLQRRAVKTPLEEHPLSRRQQPAAGPGGALSPSQTNRH